MSTALTLCITPTKSIKAIDIIKVIEDAKEVDIALNLLNNNTSFITNRFLKKISSLIQEKKINITFILDQKQSVIIRMLQNYDLNSTDTLPKKDTREVLLPSPLPSDKPAFFTHSIENIYGEKTTRGFYFIGFLFFLVFVSWFLFFISPSASIQLLMKKNIVSTTQNIIVSTTTTSTIPLSESNLPKISAIILSTDIEGTEIFPTSGRKYKLTNAFGKVTLYNETSRSKFLVPSRLITEDGVVVRMQSAVTIPPSIGTDPGTISVDVVADEYDVLGKPIGLRGNIIAGTDLKFLALSSSAQKLFYAKVNLGPLVGGSTHTDYFLAEGDIEAAEERFIEILEIKARSILQNKVNARSKQEQKNYILLEKNNIFLTTVNNIVKPDISLIGTNSKTLEISGNINLKGLVFIEDDVIETLRMHFFKNQDTGKRLISIDPSSLEYSILSDESLSKESSWIKISASAKGVESFWIDSQTNEELEEWQNKLSQDIAGKTTQEAAAILNNKNEIQEVIKIKIKPFWLKKIPSIFDKINFVSLSE